MTATDGNFPNTFQVPNAFVDDYLILLTKDEALCLLVAAREILGWKDKRLDKKAHISLSQFRRYVPTTRGAISKALKSLCQYHILTAIGKPTSDGQEYEITAVTNDAAVDVDGLQKRQAEQFKKTHDKTEKARAAKLEKAMIKKAAKMAEEAASGLSDRPAVYSTDQRSDTQTSGLSDRPVSGLTNRPTGGLSDRHNETNDQTHSLNPEDKDSPAQKAAPEAETIKPVQADAPAKKKPPARPRPKDPLFEAVCMCVTTKPYSRATKSDLSKTGLVIEEMLSYPACDDNPPTPDEIRELRKRYADRTGGLTFPEHPPKIAKWFVALFRGGEAPTNGPSKIITADGVKTSEESSAAIERTRRKLECQPMETVTA